MAQTSAQAWAMVGPTVPPVPEELVEEVPVPPVPEELVDEPPVPLALTPGSTTALPPQLGTTQAAAATTPNTNRLRFMNIVGSVLTVGRWLGTKLSPTRPS
jgi:hypothetical protein